MHGKFSRRVNDLGDGSNRYDRGSGGREYSVKVVLGKSSLFGARCLVSLTRLFPNTEGGWSSSLGCSPSLKLSSEASSSETRSLGRKWGLSRAFSNVGVILALVISSLARNFSLLLFTGRVSGGAGVGEFLSKEQKNANQNM